MPISSANLTPWQSMSEAPVQHETDKRLMELYVSHQDLLYGYIVSLLPNWADAEDIFQQTSLILWEKRDQYDPSRPFIAWAYGIARNVVLNYRRKNPAGNRTLSPDLYAKVEEARTRVGDLLQEQSSALQHCLGRLSSKQRMFVMNCYSRQMTFADLAKQMGLSENAVYLRLSRIRKVLMDCIRRTLRMEDGS